MDDEIEVPAQQRALVVVDVQNDFCEGGALPVAGGIVAAQAITRRLQGDHGYGTVVATRDAHVDPGEHFADEPDFRNSWPRHCVAGTPGADFHPQLRFRDFDAVFDKGARSAAYSGFEGSEPSGAMLGPWLRSRGITHVDVCGIATDHCVLATAIDAALAGFTTTVLLDLTAAVDRAGLPEVMTRLADAGVATEGQLPVLAG